MANEGLAKLEELLYLGSKTKTVIDSMKTETENAIASQISRVYKPSGSVSLASLPDPAESILGNVYNVSDNFTTDDKFVEGAGHKYTAGTNVAVVKVDNEYKFDVNDYLDILSIWYRDVLLFKATHDANHLIFKEEIQYIRKVADKSAYEGIEKIIDALEKSKQRLSANVNFDLTMELLLLTIKEN